MKLKFKIQDFQTEAVAAVVDCFTGQPLHMGTSYTIDPGVLKVKIAQEQGQLLNEEMQEELLGLKNADVSRGVDILKNIQTIQAKQNLHISDTLVKSIPCPINLDIEMETGTGKTYCYIKTIFELHKNYGWSKFIIVVPSIAIREGVRKSFELTAEHFTESYNEKASFFIYNSKQLEEIESFSSNSGINVMIINVQAFNATGKDARRIYEELDGFKSRKPIDVISANRPILILDEPQKMEGKKTLEALGKFKPLFILRYSATHKTTHNKIYRLDALDAYNQKLVKKIAVRGIHAKGLAGTSSYLYLDSIELSKNAPNALLELEVKQSGNSIKRKLMRIRHGDDLFVKAGNFDQYQGFVVSDIDYRTDTIEFTNGVTLHVGEAVGDMSKDTMRHIQIRDAIKSHLEKEKQLYAQGVKVLTLFFIDEVVKYRDYAQEDSMGQYARWFEEEYEKQVQDFLHGQLPVGHEEYRKYLKNIRIADTHKGYFSIDKKSKQLIDPEIDGRGENVGLGKNQDDYELILKDKERLLSLSEPARFIFSHSALREGWDNPNVFVICMLKHSDSTVSRRQEVGRGLRLSVNQFGERMDDPTTVHDVNILTVVTSEGYTDFVSNLQREIGETLSARPHKADAAYFMGKTIQKDDGSTVELTEELANTVQAWLVLNGYTHAAKHTITPEFHTAKATHALAPLPLVLEPFKEGIEKLIDALYNPDAKLEMPDARKIKNIPLNTDRFYSAEFKKLWSKINHKAVYTVDFDSTELIEKSITTLNASLSVTPLHYIVQAGMQKNNISDTQLKNREGFELTHTNTEAHKASVHSGVPYDLLGKIAENTKLTRQTIASILQGIHSSTFAMFEQNPEHFIGQVSQHINEQKASCIIEKLTYDCLEHKYDIDIFTEAQTCQDLGALGKKLDRHIYDYAITDSKVERQFVEELDTDKDVAVYAKLPRGFFIPTPIGNYNPDWAIAFTEGSVKHIYFVAETKGSMSSLELRGIEEKKISCARKFFDAVNEKINGKNVKYGIVTSYEQLMGIVGEF